MSDQDDWEFAGPDDAKAEIRAAVGYLLRGAIGGARGDIVQEIIAIVRQVAGGLPPEPPNSLDDGLPAARWLPQTRSGIGFCRLSCGACQSEGFMVRRGCRMKSSKSYCNSRIG
jgi:hypothetical protein